MHNTTAEDINRVLVQEQQRLASLKSTFKSYLSWKSAYLEYNNSNSQSPSCHSSPFSTPPIHVADSDANIHALLNKGLDLLNLLLLLQPDDTSLWNMRKRILLAILFDADKVTICHDEIKCGKSIQAELDLTCQCLKINPKAYAPWYHRYWLFVQCCGGTNGLSHHLNWDTEMNLLTKLLLLDPRNCISK
jgi:Protein prenyltransferase alpha subunit repeat